MNRHYIQVYLVSYLFGEPKPRTYDILLVKKIHASILEENFKPG